VLYPVPVQGVDAAPQIVQALQLAGKRAECDVLILARGGGSLEDLWAFNEEIVARAVRACPLPVVSGVGHEIDFTIADFAADLRAPTPSAAAESVVPDGGDLLRRFNQSRQRLSMLAQYRLERAGTRLGQLQHRLAQCHPEQRLQRQRQRLDESETRLQRAVGYRVESAGHRLAGARTRLWAERPHLRLKHAQERLERIQHALDGGINRRLIERSRQLAALGRALAAVSPLGTLERGYAIVRRASDGAVVQDAAQAPVGTRLRVRLSQGQLACQVEEVSDA
jgi:exodeoxyribonuclease VII large subunit